MIAKRYRAVVDALKTPLVGALFLIQFIYVLMVLLWAHGAFQSMDLLMHDWLTQISVVIAPAPPGPIVLVGADDRDLDLYGWPLPDGVLAKLLETLEQGAPRAIGLDIYRPSPVPPGGADLAETLGRHANIIGAFKLAGVHESGIAAPAALQQSGSIGFADTITDPGGLVRRSLLFADDGVKSYPSLAMQLSLVYLAGDNIRASFDGDTLVLGKARLLPLSANEGGYVGVDDRGYQLLLDFRNGEHPFRLMHLRDVLQQPLPGDAVKDKVVLIGIEAESVKDFFFTPFTASSDHGLLYGIEVHAQLVAQLIRHALSGEREIEGLPRPIAALVIWICCMSGGLAAKQFRSPLRLAVICFVMIATFVALAVGGFLSSVWLPFAAPTTGWLASVLMVTAVISRTEKEQRDALMQIFSRNVSKDIAQNLWEQRDAFMKGGRPHSQSLVATVLFTDIRDFTTISEGTDPTTLLDWLNTYMEEMAQVVSLHGGIIDKFIGDAIMAVFGIPVPRLNESEIASDARNAIDCALGMSKVLDGLNAAWRTQGAPVAGMRVGIFTGRLVAGPLGSNERMNYTVIGDTVNTAARLESFDKSVGKEFPCRIIVGGPTRELVGDDYLFKPVGEVSLKGKSQPITAFIVLGMGEGAAPEPALAQNA